MSEPAKQSSSTKMKEAFIFRMRLADGFFGIGKVVSFGVPGYFLWRVFETFGGKTTTFSVFWGIKVSVAVSVTSVVAIIIACAKMKKQKKELIRCRQRTDRLETMLSEKQKSEKE